MTNHTHARTVRPRDGPRLRHHGIHLLPVKGRINFHHKKVIKPIDFPRFFPEFLPEGIGEVVGGVGGDDEDTLTDLSQLCWGGGVEGALGG